MNASARFWGAGVLLAAGLTGVPLLRPGWLAALGVDRPAAKAHSRVAAESTEESRRALRRAAAKQDLVAWLRAGKMTLAEAAEFVRFLDADCPGALDRRKFFPGETDEERLRNQILSWLQDDPTRGAAEAVARLEGG